MNISSLSKSIYCLILAVGVVCCPATVLAVPVTDGLSLWLDASDAATLFTDAAMTVPANPGDPIGGWMDKSGNNYHATQPDAAKQPAWEAAVMNGQPGLRFSGIQDEPGGILADGMIIDDGLNVVRPYSVFIVNQYYGDIRGRTLQARGGPNWLHGLWAGNISSYADAFIGGNPPADVNFAYVADTTGTPTGDSTLFVNGLDFTVNPAAVGQPGNLGLLSEGGFPEFSDADISEVVIYDRVLDSTELASVRDFLYTKYDATILAPPNPQNTILGGGTLGTFTGGDAGEGLDLDGQFAYAINVGGPGDVSVRDAAFTDGSQAGMAGGSSPGATINVANEIPEWHAPAYGDSANDDNLETVMQSIRWTGAPDATTVDLDVVPGQEYELQLLFAENCCDRGFDITVEDELMVDNFNIPLTQGDGDIAAGIANTSQGVVYSTTLVAGDESLNIVLGPVNPLAPDNNATLSGVTLEVVPEPSGMLLSILGLFGVMGWSRRRVR